MLSATTSTVTVTGRNIVQVDVSTVLPRAQVQRLSNLQLTEADGTIVRIRSTHYNARTHRGTLRLAHPLPAGVQQANLRITGLDAKPAHAPGHARKAPRR